MIETLYNDFTTKLLPKIQEGLVITKDYFLDLFGRYVKYLIVTDTISIIIFVAVFILGIIFVKKGIKMGIENKWDDMQEFNLVMLSGFAIIIGFIGSIDYSMKLVKDIYIPEIRVIEQLKSFNQ